MLQHRTSKLLALAVVVASFVFVLHSYPVYAADSVNFNANAARGLQVSPAIVNLNAEPGKTYTLTVSVLNVTNSSQTYAANVEDFKAKDETGTPELVVDTSLPTNVSPATWLSPISKFSLNGGQSTDISITVHVPANAEPGGHYGAIVFSGAATYLGSQQQVGVTVKTGLLLLIRVAGDVQEQLNIASFNAEQNNKPNSFFENGPLNFVTRFQNTGNVHVQPVGTIEVTDMFNHKVADLGVNSEKSNVLPSSIRRFDSQLHSDWMFGPYTANLLVGYGTKGQALTGQITFWVIPYKLILTILVVVVTVFYIGRKLLRSYNQHIINQSRNNGKKTSKAKSKKRSRR